MLYGYIIFIKKAGGDGSKYPVSEKNVKIGRSEECLIRIYNTQVALEHCQLIIGENGQATLKDLSNQTFLNGNILANEEATLCHGDVFKVGERLARWEYLPTSKYYRQLLSPTGRLVAVVMPQQRCLEDQPSGTSASFESALKNTPVGGKKRYSERFGSENASAVKRRKSSSSNLIKQSKGDLSKMLTGRYSLKTSKVVLPVAKIKDLRKSTSGINSARTPKGKSRKSALPSWKINSVSPATTLTEKETDLSLESLGKSTKSSGSVDNPLLNHSSHPVSENLSSAKKRLRSPHKNTVTLSEEIVKSTSKDILKTLVEVPVGAPLKTGRYIRSARSLSDSPSPKKPTLMSTPSAKPLRLFHSEKPKSNVRKSSVHIRELKRLSEVLTRSDKSRGDEGWHGNFSYEELKNLEGAGEVIADLKAQPQPGKSNVGFPDKIERTSIKVKTSEKFDKFSNKNLMNKALGSSEGGVKTPRVNETEKVQEPTREKLKTPVPIHIFQASPLNESDLGIDSKKGRQVLRVRNKSVSAKSTPLKNTPKKSGKNVGEVTPSSSRKNLSKSLLLFSRTSAARSASARSPKSSSVRISLRKTINLSKERISSPRGVRRKLSPSISSAERAAKELKTSSPKKPDKNKKAALLVLGKANRKQLLAQNVKVLLKQKILKKAIKQSTTASAGKIDNGKKKSLTVVERKSKKGLQNNTSKIKKGRKNVSSKRNATASSSKSAEVPFQNKNETGYNSKGENALEENLISDSKVSETSPRSPSKLKNLFSEAPGKSLSNQYMNSESNRSIHSKETSSPYENLEQAADNFLFNSNRRCSKRLSSKNDFGRPDFVELSPTALGLMPKNLEVFKTPKSSKRRNSSLATPKMVQSVGIIKSASTSKIGSRKNVRFSSKDFSMNSEFSTLSEKSDFDLGAYQTPDVSVDVFISPLGDRTSGSKKGLNESPRIKFASDGNSELESTFRSNSEPRKCIRKLLQSPEPKITVSSNEFQRGPRSSVIKDRKQTTDPENSKRSLCNFSSEVYTTVQNISSDVNVKRVKKLPQTPRMQKSPKNDLSDLRGVKKLLATPKAQKSPKNDLSDLRGVKKLLATPKAQKSPKNDLSDLRGVKKLLATPKAQKSPKNDLSDLRGVKKLLATPKAQVQKSPKNDLLELSGIQELFGTPKHHRRSRSKSAEARKESLSEFLVQNIIKPTRNQKLSKDSSQSCQLGEGETGNILNIDGGKQVPKSGRSRKSVSRKSLAVDKVQGKRSTSEEAKNDLSDVMGVRELFASYESNSDLNESLTGVPQLFSLPELEAVSTLKGRTRGRKSTTGVLQKVPKVVSPAGETESKDGYIKTRMNTRNILKTASAEESTKISVRFNKSKTDSDLKTVSTGEKQTKRKATERTKPSEAMKSNTVKRSERIKKGAEKRGRTSQARTKPGPEQSGEIKTRKRKATVENTASPPSKQRRNGVAARTEKSKTASVPSEKVKNIRKTSAKVRDEKAKSLSKVQSETFKTNKVQKKRSQSSSKKNLSDSQEKFSPRKTRSVKRAAASQQNGVGKRKASTENKISGGKKVTPVVKKPVRRK